MKHKVFRFVSFTAPFVIASLAAGWADVTDGERINSAANFFERVGTVRAGISLAWGEQTLGRTIETQAMFIRHTATKLQRQVAEQNARAYVAQLTPEKKLQLKKKKIQYIAVPTVRSKETSQEAKEVLMIYDIPRETLVGKSVYELATTPKVGQLATYDDLVAEYVGPTPKNF